MSDTGAITTTVNVNVDINVEDMAEVIGQLPPDLLVRMVRLIDSCANDWATTRMLAHELNALALEYFDDVIIDDSYDPEAYDTEMYKWVDSEVDMFSAILERYKNLKEAGAESDDG